MTWPVSIGHVAAWVLYTCTIQLQVQKGRLQACEAVKSLSRQQQEELFPKAQEGTGRAKSFVKTWDALVHVFKRTRESCKCCVH